MLSFNEEGEDFFDANDSLRTSTDSSSSEECFIDGQNFELREFKYEVWMKELMSVQERRNRFFRRMGFHEFVPVALSSSQDQEEFPGDRSTEAESERSTGSNGAILNSPSLDDGIAKDCKHYTRDMDCGKAFLVHNLGTDGFSSMLKEGGSDNLITPEELDSLLGLSHSLQNIFRRELSHYEKKTDGGYEAIRKHFTSWWRFSKRKQRASYNISSRSGKLFELIRARVQQHKKKCLEFTAMCKCQEIQAHKGFIRAMKFSPSGWYLASGGEDCITRVWKIKRVETSCKCFSAEVSSQSVDNIKGAKMILGSNSVPIVIPGRIFKIEENPVHEFHGHTSDILDLSWSKTNCLLTSSKDKTVRLWKVGCQGCLKVFQHNDYVTCVQFNPIDDGYFITGSLDGKVRVWQLEENRVVNWIDIRDIITALCYQPNGKQGFLVGSIAGACRFYGHSDESMQLETQFYVHGKKKSGGKRITSLQFSPDDSQMAMITSAELKFRIFDGGDIIQKFSGPRKSRSQISASFTSDGKYIISVGEDSHVYIWNNGGSGSLSSRVAKSVSSCELFLSEGLSVAVPWPGIRGGAGQSNNNLQPSSLRQTSLDPSTVLGDRDCFSLGPRLLLDGSTKGSATWPEESLPSSPCSSLQADKRLTPASWGLVIITASSDGVIRSFHNYGLPVRL
ncbi:uncharacterized protein [Typha latifolia]|uniref:uncharacterized protein isoform X1 n=1 Tax=Typha latifolia TaxID=4733 RepID=UPI003C302A9A